MSKRIYHLSIEYDSETEEVEYILETLDEVEDPDGSTSIVKIGEIELNKHFDKETLEELAQCQEIGET